MKARAISTKTTKITCNCDATGCEWQPKKRFADCVSESECPESSKSYGSPEKYLKPTIDYSLKNKIIRTKSDALIAHIRVQSKGQ